MMMKVLLLVCIILLTAQSADCSTVIYSNADYTLKATICKPAGNGPFPAIIYHHGGVGKIIGGAPKETCNALMAKGFVGFSPIRRPTKPLPGHMDDVKAALAYLKTLDYVDQKRIGIMGFSKRCTAHNLSIV
jgi:dienelactone hydrolase